ncbi:MAG: AAA family ATPase [Pedobacter sp.]
MLVKISLIVDRVLSTQGGGAIFTGKSNSGEIKVVAPYNIILQTPGKDEVWTVTGVFEHHPKHGKQLRASHLLLDMPSGRLVIDYLTKSPTMRGFALGAKKIKSLKTTFGPTLRDHLELGDVKTLVQAEGISVSLASELVERWKAASLEIRVIWWLSDHEIDFRLAKEIIRAWGPCSIDLLSNDPYKLLAFTGWKLVDNAARLLGISGCDNRRLLGAVEAALYSRHDKAHTLTPHSKLLAKVRANLNEGDSSLPIKALTVAKEIKVLVGNKQDGYQHRGVARLERRIRERLLAIHGRKEADTQLVSAFEDKDIECGIRAAEKALSARQNKNITLNKKQKQAVYQALEEKFSIICGGIGTGKNTVLLAIYEVLEKTGTPVVQMAPSGPAARRMRDLTLHPALPIAKFCMDVRSGKRQVVEDTFFIIVESSMVDLSSMYRLLSCIPGGASILMVGDSRQLPPDSFGLVFHKLVESVLVPKVELEVICSQEKDSAILDVAEGILLNDAEKANNAILPFNPSTPERPGVFFIECSLEDIPTRVSETFEGLKNDDIESTRILGSVQNGRAGVYPLNQLLQHQQIEDHSTFYGGEIWKYAVGDPVIFIENDYELELFKNSLGIITNISLDQENGWTISAHWDDGKARSIHEKDFDQIELAYSLPIHRSQGSKWKNVIVPMHKNRNLNNSIIYTALTRGMERVIFVGDRSAFINAINKRYNRDVGFYI